MCFVSCFLCSPVLAQPSSARLSTEQAAGRLITARQWQQVVRLLAPVHPRTTQMNYDYGLALAHLGRWSEADAALRAGQRLARSDPRFPIELAGIAFRQKDYPRAARLLRHALKLAPGDAYANNFLATVYFLQGNTEAALKYWNRVNKPFIAVVHAEPEPRVSPALLDHAFAFAPAAVMSLEQYRDSEERIRGLGIFPRHQLDLRALSDGRFDAVFRGHERNGFGDGKWEAALLFLRGLPFQSVTPEYGNFRRRAINFQSLFRWDAQKRRAFLMVSAPLRHGADYRYELSADLRNENWVLRNSFTGPSPALASLNLRREVLAFNLVSHASARIGWSAGAELSHRDYRDVVPGAVLSPRLLASGFQLKQASAVRAALLQIPERRFTLDASASSQAARIWSSAGQTYEKLQGSLGWHWLPQASGDDYEMRQRFRAGITFGQPPFDELFMLGLERDNNLPMRAHIGTRDGRKGSAPLGGKYFLASWEADKNLYENGLISLKAGPFLDSGQITGSSVALGSRQWLWDAGAQVKFRVLGAGVVFSYGKDLRTGKDAFYLNLLP